MKCKLNDLCFVIKSNNIKNIGKVVTCTEYLGYLSIGRYEYYSSKYGKCYYTIDTQGHYWLTKGNLINIDGIHLEISVFNDTELCPIPTEPIEDSEISSKELEFN